MEGRKADHVHGCPARCPNAHTVICCGTFTAGGQQVLVATERAVFRLTEAGLELIEVAPGSDVDPR